MTCRYYWQQGVVFGDLSGAAALDHVPGVPHSARTVSFDECFRPYDPCLTITLGSDVFLGPAPVKSLGAVALGAISSC